MYLVVFLVVAFVVALVVALVVGFVVALVVAFVVAFVVLVPPEPLPEAEPLILGVTLLFTTSPLAFVVVTAQLEAEPEIE